MSDPSCQQQGYITSCCSGSTRRREATRRALSIQRSAGDRNTTPTSLQHESALNQRSYHSRNTLHTTDSHFVWIHTKHETFTGFLPHPDSDVKIISLQRTNCCPAAADRLPVSPHFITSCKLTRFQSGASARCFLVCVPQTIGRGANRTHMLCFYT